MRAGGVVGSLLTVAAVLLSQSAAAERAALIHGAFTGWNEQMFKAEFDGAFKALGIEHEKQDKYLALNLSALTEKLDDYDLVVVGFGVDGKDLVFSEEAIDKWNFWFEGGGVVFVSCISDQGPINPWVNAFGQEFYLRPAGLCTAYQTPTMANQQMAIDRDALLEFPLALGKAIYNRGKQWVHFLDPAPGWKMPVRCVDDGGLFAYREVGAGLMVYTQIWDLRDYGTEVTVPIFANLLAYARFRKAGFRPTVANGSRLALANEKAKARQLTVRATTNEETPVVKTVSLKPGQTVELFPEAKRKAFGTVRHHLKITEGGKTTLDWGWTEKVDPPITAEMRSKDVFAGQELKARFTFNPTEGKKPTGFEWCVDGGKWTLVKEGTDLSVPVKALKPGAHELSYRLRVKGELSPAYVGKTAFTVRKETAYCQRRADGALLLDGKPFFPFGFYDVILWNNAEPIRTEIVTNMSNWGYNMAQMCVKSKELPPESDIFSKFLDFCQEKNVKLLVGCIGDTNLPAHASACIGRHPAVLGWSISDEPASRNYPPSAVRRDSDMIHADSPDRLTYTCMCAPGNAFRYSSCLDVIATDPYPNGGPLSCIWDNLTSARDGIAYGGAIQWVSLQLHGGQGHEGTPEVTPRMFRSQAYIAVMAGVKGIIYYTYRDFRFIITKSSTELQEAVAKFPSEFNRYTPYFLDGKLTVVSDGGADKKLYAATWELGGKKLYVAVNAAREGTVEATVPFAGGEIQCKDESVEVTKAPGGAMKLKLGPVDRIVILK